LENNNLTELKKIIELLLFINGKPISERKLMEVLETDKDIRKETYGSSGNR